MKFLPFVVLPNTANAQDSTVIYTDGTVVSTSDAIKLLGAADALRFMVGAGDLRPASDPRLTWQATELGAIVSAAFVAAEDEHHRATSAAAVFLVDRIDDLWEFAVPPLPAVQLEELRGFLQSERDAIISQIVRARAMGVVSGELDSSKKKLLRDSSRSSYC